MRKDSILVGYQMADGTTGTVMAPRIRTKWIGLHRWPVYDLSGLPQGRVRTLMPPLTRRVCLDVPTDRLVVRASRTRGHGVSPVS